MVGLFSAFFAVSLSCIPGVCLLFLCRAILHKKLAAGVMCVLCAALCIRLLLPFTISLPRPIITIPRADTQEVVITVPAPNREHSSLVVIDAPTLTPSKGSSQGAKSEYVFSAPVFFTAVWLIGIALYGTYLLLGYLHLRRLIFRWKNAKVDAQLLHMASGAVSALGLKQKILFVQCSRVGSPMLTGIFKPCLLLPCTERYTSAQWQFVLSHELMHLKRRDLLLKIILALVKCLHWYNPFVWLLCREANRGIELACDSAVVQNKENAFRRDYSNALLYTLAHKPIIPLALTTYFFDGNKRSLLRRFANISAKKYRTTGIVLAAVFAAFAIIFGCIIGVAPKNAINGTSTSNTAKAPPAFSGVLKHTLEIASAQDLLIFAKRLSTMSYAEHTTVELRANIDLGGAVWEPIALGTADTFIDFNGNGYQISNFIVNEFASENTGFFSQISKGSAVYNLHLQGDVFHNFALSENGYSFSVGGFAGSCSGTIEKSSFTGNVSGAINVAGFVGSAFSGAQITNCGASAVVTASIYGGGFIVQPAYDAYIKNCWAQGKLIAKATDGLSMTDAYGNNNYSIAYIGGFSAYSGNFSNCVADNEILCYDIALLLAPFTAFHSLPVDNCSYNKDKSGHWDNESGNVLAPEQNTPDALARALNTTEINNIIASFK